MYIAKISDLSAMLNFHAVADDFENIPRIQAKAPFMPLVILLSTILLVPKTGAICDSNPWNLGGSWAKLISIILSPFFSNLSTPTIINPFTNWTWSPSLISGTTFLLNINQGLYVKHICFFSFTMRPKDNLAERVNENETPQSIN